MTTTASRKVFVEASAGTGKTESIQCHLLKRLLDPSRDVGVAINRTLIVSHTNAAAAELRSRVQDTIEHAISALGGSVAWRNADAEAAASEADGTVESKIARLYSALAAIHRLRIGTIHSFCADLIRRFPVECQFFSHLSIISDLSNFGMEAAADAFDDFSKSLHKQGVWIRLEQRSQALQPKSPTPSRLKKLAEEVAKSSLPVIEPAPSFPVVSSTSVSNSYSALLNWFAHEVRRRMRQRMDRLGMISQTDLIRIVEKAIGSPGSPLCARVAAEFDDVILDEAQDADPSQWRILETLAQPSARFLAVGDPKQLIYSFQGADIRSLPPELSPASWEINQSLATNYRSDKPLLCGLNALFTGSDLHHFRHLTPAHDCRLHESTGEVGSGLFVHVAQGQPDTNFYLESAFESIAEAILQELQSNLQVTDSSGGSRPLGPGDIAVLVPTNHMVEQLRQALISKRIPVAAPSRDSLLDSDEIRELAAVFTAISKPFDGRSVGAAAMTRIVGFDNPRLNRMLENPRTSVDGHDLVERLSSCRELLALKGLSAALDNILDTPWTPRDLSARERILREPDGERSMKNLLDLADMLRDAFWRSGQWSAPTAGEVSDWLLKSRGKLEQNQPIESLETDGDAVFVMTIHAAKGRQFGIVWIPDSLMTFSKERFYDRGQPWRVFDDRSNIKRLVLNAGADPVRAKSETQQAHECESRRLFYVAATRAKYRTHLVVGCYDTGRNDIQPTSIMIAKDTLSKFGRNETSLLNTGLNRLAAEVAKCGGRMVRAILPPPDPNTGFVISDPPPEPVQHPAPDIPRAMRLSSFSSLLSLAKTRNSGAAGTHGPELSETVSGDPHAEPTVDLEEGEETSPPARIDDEPDEPDNADEAVVASPLSIPPAVLPASRKSGDLVHRVLEFVLPVPRKPSVEQLSRVIQSFADAEGFPATSPARSQLAEPLLAAISQPLGGPAFANLSLLDLVTNGSVAVEVPFNAALDITSRRKMADVHALLARHSSGDFQGFEQHCTGLEAVDARGLFTGFIDLAWIGTDGRVALVDHKTNWLKPSADGADPYSRAQLAKQMASSRYLLQAAVYAAVVDVWMRLADTGWDYESRFKGVSFAFLRAMGHRTDPLSVNNGVFHVQVPVGLARGLADLLGLRATKPTMTTGAASP